MTDFSFLMVVSPADDAAKLNRCLNSLVSQRVCAKQILLVVNGNLPKPLMRILHQFNNVDRFEFIESSTTLSLGLALNLGIESISSEWILRIDPDDISLKERVALAEKCVRNNNFDLGFFSNYEIGTAGTPIFKRLTPDHFSVKKFMIFNPVAHTTALIKKNILVNIGNYKDIYLAEDYELWLRFIMANKIIKFFPDFAIIYDTEGLVKRRRGLKTIIGETKILQIKNLINPRFKVVNFLIFVLRIVYRVSPTLLITFFYAKFISKRQRVENIEEATMVLKYL